MDGVDKVGVTACQASKLLLRLAVNFGGVQGGDAAQLVSGLARELAASDSSNVSGGAGSDKVDDLLWHVDGVGQFHEAVANDFADPLDVQSCVLLEVLDGIAQLDHDQVSGFGIILVIVLFPALLLLLFGGVGVGTRVGLKVVALLVCLDQFACGLLHLGGALRQTLDEDGHLVVTEVLLAFHSLDEVVQVELDLLPILADNVTANLAGFRGVLWLKDSIELGQMVYEWDISYCLAARFPIKIRVCLQSLSSREAPSSRLISWSLFRVTCFREGSSSISRGLTQLLGWSTPFKELERLWGLAMTEAARRQAIRHTVRRGFILGSVPFRFSAW